MPQQFLPEIIDPQQGEGITRLDAIRRIPGVQISDTYRNQIRELVKISHPQHRLTEEELDKRAGEWILEKGIPQEKQGCYVYYPWRNALVHLVEKELFIRLRTSRNMYKITPEEQELLNGKTVGVIGLSVGQSVSVTMAMERCAGTLRLADFDDLELTNLNRLRAGVFDLGLPKTIIAARQIAEQDPFIKVELYPEGIHQNNVENFLTGVDLLIEECDSLEVKLQSRLVAREKRIPVLMDTSDRGMLDVERFDLEPERPLFHNRVPGLDQLDLSSLDPRDRMGLTLQLVDAHLASDRAKYSLSEIGKTITTWPQLASSVVAGGGFTTEMARKILLGHSNVSGRFHMDLDQIITQAHG